MKLKMKMVGYWSLTEYTRHWVFFYCCCYQCYHLINYSAHCKECTETFKHPVVSNRGPERLTVEHSTLQQAVGLTRSCYQPQVWEFPKGVLSKSPAGVESSLSSLVLSSVHLTIIITNMLIKQAGSQSRKSIRNYQFWDRSQLYPVTIGYHYYYTQPRLRLGLV